MPSDRPILVTGCPRSGTTWTGNVIGESRDVFHVYEPFNNDIGAKLKLPERFMRLETANSVPYRAEIDDLIALGSFKRRSALAVRGVAERWLPGPSRYTPARLAARRLLRHRRDFVSPRRICIKDPIAFYSSEWIAATYSAQVVVMLRHPCGVIGSYLSLDWDSELDDIVRHPIPSGYASLENEIKERASKPKDRLRDLILQWKLFTACTLDLKQRHPDWLFVLHDDLCMHPDAYFAYLFEALDLEYTVEIAAKITRESSSSQKQSKRLQHQHERNSRTIVDAWRKSIPSEVADIVLLETEELWSAAQQSLSLSVDSEHAAELG